jgi:DNA-directed RNA polymerase
MSLTQKQLDKEMVDGGKSRYWGTQNKAVAGEREADTNYGIRLLNAAVYPVAEALREEYLTIGKAGFNNTGVASLLASEIDPEVLALLALQSILDGISKQQRASRVMSVIGRRIQTEALLNRLAVEQPWLLKTMKGWTADPQSDLRRRATIRKITMNASAEMAQLVQDATLDEPLLLRMGWVLVELIRRHTGLIDIKNITVSAKRTNVWIVPTPETLEWIRQYGSACEFLRPVKLPMVVPPYDWSQPTVGGYANELGEDLIRSESGLQMTCATKEVMPVVYAVVNRMQGVPLRVNSATLEVVSQLWDNGVTFGDIPRRDDTMTPVRPEGLDGKDPVVKIWRREVHRIQERNRTEAGRRINFAQTLALGKRFQGMNIFSPICMDFRGRIYPQVSFLSYQGTDVGKGLLSFANAKPVAVNSDAWRMLMLAGVGHAGAKGSIIDRLNLAEKFVSEGLVKAVAADPFQHRSLWMDRDEPVQFLSWCNDVVGVLNGKPSSHPVWQDGSVNGLQVISLLLRDEVGGGLTNCVEADIRSVPHDMYQQVAARTLQLLQQEERPDKVAWAKQWIDYGVDRSCVKRCVMIVLGSLCSVLSTMAMMLSRRVERGFMGRPRRAFGSDMMGVILQ